MSSNHPAALNDSNPFDRSGGLPREPSGFNFDEPHDIEHGDNAEPFRNQGDDDEFNHRVDHNPMDHPMDNYEPITHLRASPIKNLGAPP